MLQNCKSIYVSFFFATTLLLGACTSLPEHKSTLQEDGKIKPQQANFSNKGEQPLQAHWWLALNDKTLNQLVNQALNSNLNLQAGFLKIQQSRLLFQSTQANQAFKVDGTAAISNNTSETKTLSNNVDKYSVGLTASYEIDLWNKLANQTKSSALDITSTQLDYKTLALTISAEVALAWYRLVEQKEQLQLLKQQLLISEDYLTLIEQQFKSGLALAADVLQQRQTVESVKGDFFTAKKLQQQFINQLALLTSNSSLTVTIADNVTISSLPPLPKTGLKANVLKNRPDIKAAFNNLAKTDIAIAIAVANRYPRISFSTSYNRNGTTLVDIFDNWASNLAVNLIVPIIDGDAKKLAVEQNKLSYQQALLKYKDTLLTAVKEVEDALSNEQQQKAYVSSLKKQLLLSNQAKDQIRNNYINGAVDFQRVLSAIVTDQNLQRVYLRAKRELMEYRINLYRALSGGWKIEG